MMLWATAFFSINFSKMVKKTDTRRSCSILGALRAVLNYSQTSQVFKNL